METIEVKDITLTQYMKLKGFRIRKEIEGIMDIPTYYRVIKWNYKKGPHKGSLEKLRKWLNLEKGLFDVLLENEHNK